MRLIEAVGAWPFVTRRTLRAANGEPVVQHSRRLRKALTAAATDLRRDASLLRCLWMPRRLNWWIGSLFALGSLLFALGSVLSLMPGWAHVLDLSAQGVNAIFFAGSIPFTAAAWLQLNQAANAPRFGDHGRSSPARRFMLFGWRPREIGWLGCALQFAGTLLFNLSTFDGVKPGLGWAGQDLQIWVPDFAGSALFLASGYLGFIEVCHAHWAWRPHELSWWVTFANLLGCIAFMLSALFAFVPQHPVSWPLATLAVAFTLLGAIGFLIGSLLMLPEAA